MCRRRVRRTAKRGLGGGLAETCVRRPQELLRQALGSMAAAGERGVCGEQRHGAGGGEMASTGVRIY